MSPEGSGPRSHMAQASANISLLLWPVPPTLGPGRPYRTRRWALRESLPPADSTRQVYVPMSPDHVCEMCREPFLSRRMRGLLSVPRAAPSFSQTYLRGRSSGQKRGVGK